MKVSARGRRLKGSLFERAAVAYFNDGGIPARRMPLSGAVKGFESDLEACIHRLHHWVCDLEKCQDRKRFECKHRAKGWAELYKWIEGNYGVLLRRDLPPGKKAPADMGALVVLRFEDFKELIKR